MQQSPKQLTINPLSASPRSSRVLIVDDELVNREMLTRMLATNGYECESVESGEAALRRLESQDFDLVLLDVVMPEMDGFGCLASIRKKHSMSELPVIIVTAETERNRIVQGFRLGANDYVIKPIDREILLARLATHTQLRTSLIALKSSEERYALSALGSNDGLWDWDVLRGDVYYSPRWKAMLGYAESELTNSFNEWLNRIHIEDQEEFRKTFVESNQAGESSLRCEIRMIHRDGTYRWMICRGVSVRNEAGQVYRMAGSLTDVTEGKVGDALTGLPNRLLFADRLQRAIERYQRNSIYSFAVIFLDIDNFKLINDSMGHQAGDQLLISIARRLETCLRHTDTICRFEKSGTVARHAGDEFTMLLEDISNASDAESVANRVLEAISQPLWIESQEVIPSASIGWTLCSSSNMDVENILREADTAMYNAKTAGRNRVRRFDPRMQQEATKRLRLQQELRQGLANQEFFLNFQPIVDLRQSRYIGFETLVRWQHPQNGVVYPGEFISVAEDLGLIVPLGWQIMEMACCQARAWAEMFPGQNVSTSINFSMKQFVQKEFLQTFFDVIERTKAPAERLCVEVTESMLVEQPDLICEILQEMRDSGIKIAVDDFGTGYSSLAYLHRFPIDVLKIDRSFVGTMLESKENQQIVNTIINLGRSLRLRVIAEGVETQEQCSILQELGCDYGQGFLWSKPVDVSRASSILSTQQSVVTYALAAPVANLVPDQYT
ncbi:MAG TPA: EAL domain-containing protein [Pirellulaceae bacterium]|nr:EAL domain-containing protein [Pirellulaceae bacterium]HMO91653.1 EAL domain-containing protein [Pirellulaceae bacterium]HMP68350.1 EAL domain-containing protein [Pirellulaceae bacterium]